MGAVVRAQARTLQRVVPYVTGTLPAGWLWVLARCQPQTGFVGRSMAGVHEATVGLILVYVFWSFSLFSCTSYGMVRPLKDMGYLMWLPSWPLAR